MLFAVSETTLGYLNPLESAEYLTCVKINSLYTRLNKTLGDVFERVFRDELAIVLNVETKQLKPLKENQETSRTVGDINLRKEFCTNKQWDNLCHIMPQAHPIRSSHIGIAVESRLGNKSTDGNRMERMKKDVKLADDMNYAYLIVSLMDAKWKSSLIPALQLSDFARVFGLSVDRIRSRVSTTPRVVVAYQELEQYMHNIPNEIKGA